MDILIIILEIILCCVCIFRANSRCRWHWMVNCLLDKRFFVCGVIEAEMALRLYTVLFAETEAFLDSLLKQAKGIVLSILFS